MQSGQQPRYSLAEAALVVGVPEGRLRSWFRARLGGPDSILRLDGDPVAGPPVSFFNVVEARFLAAYRRHGVPMQRVRRALDFVSEKLPERKRPLLRPDFRTDGRALFVELAEPGPSPQLLEASAGGQYVWPAVVERHFLSLDFNDHGDPTRLWLDDRRKVMLDPRYGWGLPIVAAGGVRTDVLRERMEAGETLAAVAEDFSLAENDVSAALAWERSARNAA